MLLFFLVIFSNISSKISGCSSSGKETISIVPIKVSLLFHTYTHKKTLCLMHIAINGFCRPKLASQK